MIVNINIYGDTPAPTWKWHVGPVVPKETAMPVEITLTTEQKCRVFVTPMTSGGQPAALDGPVLFSISGPCTLTPIDDTSTWVVTASGIGDSILSVQADADLGAGVVPLADSATIRVVNPMASSLGLGADSPVLK